MTDLLKELCALNGTSGDEGDIADFIIENITTQGTVIQKDNMGNVLVFKKGKTALDKTILFAAHMDEVGFIVTDIDKDGFIRFAPVGGISPSAVFGRRVVFKNNTVGVIGGKPTHHLNSKEKSKQPDIGDLLVDIGAESKSDAEGLVKRGDYFYFVGAFEEFGDGKIRAKAIDDRLGCAIMLDMLKSELSYDCSFAFTVQEEVGCRGANAAAFNLEPDICVVLEATTACDIADISGGDRVCELGKGVVVSYMDRGTVYDRGLYNIIFETAEQNGLKCQTKTMVAGGNDASAFHKALGGIKTAALSCPTRYLHTPLCMIDRSDFLEVRVLAEKVLDKLAVV